MFCVLSSSVSCCFYADIDRDVVANSTFYLDKYLETNYVDEEVRRPPPPSKDMLCTAIILIKYLTCFVYI